jgi:glycogen debranching enzyme
LATRFRAAFWVDDGDGPYPALALDGDKRPVDSLTSNIGHLLGTGILEPAEARAVAARLAGPDMVSGYGLRTMSTTAGGYNPSSYHCGSVWPHDTAIVALGLHREGLTDQAVDLVAMLVRAAATTDYRLPELFCGDDAAEAPALVPYPAACRPQAWSAASAGAAIQVVLGLHVDRPDELVVTPPSSAPFGPVRAAGLTFAGAPLTVEVDGDGQVRSTEAAPHVTVRVT